MRSKWLSPILLATLVTVVAVPSVAHADLGDKLTAALHAGSFLAYLLAFVGGILTSLTPCVYPLIPITLSIFGARGADVSRARALSLATVYVLGIGAMYTSLGVGVALTGRAFGTFMGSPFVIVPIAVLFLIMSASMFGAFELNLPTGLQTRLSQLGGTGFGGAFVMGLVGGIIAAPCTGPVLASLLEISCTRTGRACGRCSAAATFPRSTGSRPAAETTPMPSGRSGPSCTSKRDFPRAAASGSWLGDPERACL